MDTRAVTNRPKFEANATVESPMKHGRAPRPNWHVSRGGCVRRAAGCGPPEFGCWKGGWGVAKGGTLTH
eukprot:13730820-Alexandrium_andersonii.AAC.1